jgi:MoxR-like ATPase
MLLAMQPRFLVIDEIDKMPDHDQTPLLNLMETGMITRLQHGIQDRVILPTKVFAGANDLRRISAPILSRFTQLTVPPYSPREFVDVATAVLVQREGLGVQMAKHIATEVVGHSLDIRDAVRVARMSGGLPIQVIEVVECLWPSKPTNLTPIRR